MPTFTSLVLPKLKELPYITKEMIMKHSMEYRINPANISTYILRSIEKKQLVRLKRGVYVTRVFLNKHRTNILYAFSIASMINSKSYISLTSALSFYGLIPEVVYSSYTSITLKSRRKYSNSLGEFKYRSIDQELFDGYRRVEGEFEYSIASPAKAVFDFIYFRTSSLQKKFDREIFAEYRIDLERLTDSDLDELRRLFAKFDIKVLHL